MANGCKITQKKQRPSPNPDDIKTAILKVVSEEGSVRKIALAKNLKIKTTFQKHVNNYKKLPEDDNKGVFCAPRYNTKQVFTKNCERRINSRKKN